MGNPQCRKVTGQTVGMGRAIKRAHVVSVASLACGMAATATGLRLLNCHGSLLESGKMYCNSHQNTLLSFRNAFLVQYMVDWWFGLQVYDLMPVFYTLFNVKLPVLRQIA